MGSGRGKDSYQNSTAGLTYLTAYIYVADPHQQSPQSPAVIDSGKLSHKHSWIAENLYLIVHGVEGAPPQDLRSLNTGTQELQDLWPYTAGSFAIDAGQQAIVDRAAPQARVLWRSAGMRTDFVDRVRVERGGRRYEVGQLLSYDRPLAARLHAADRVHTYGSFHVADLAA